MNKSYYNTPQDFKRATRAEIVESNGELFAFLDSRAVIHKDIDINYDDIKLKMSKTYSPGTEPYSLPEDDEEAQKIIEIWIDDANVEQEDEYYVVPLFRVPNPLLMIKAGFFPTSFNPNSKWFTDWLNGVDLKTIAFWEKSYDFEIPQALRNLTRESRWVYYSMETWKKLGSTKANSLGLLLFAPSLVYSGSKRPVNDMIMFRTSISFRVRREEIVNNEVMLSGESWKVLPVTRYAKGMSKGLFYTPNLDSAPSNFCGTFYYHEPQSTTWLAYHTSHASFNKYTAYWELLDLVEEREPGFQERLLDTDYMDLEDDERVYQTFLDSGRKPNQVTAYSEGLLPADLMMTPYEAYEAALAHPALKNFAYPDPIGLPNVKRYAQNYFKLYAAEDQYDQPLCWLCKRLDLDVLILEHMIGSFQVVTEILDARVRKESFKSLVYVD